jgi:hypothetical protein
LLAALILGIFVIPLGFMGGYKLTKQYPKATISHPKISLISRFLVHGKIESKSN